MSFHTENRVRFDAFPSHDKQKVLLTISVYPLDTTVSFSLEEACKLADLINEAAEECGSGNLDQTPLPFAPEEMAA